MENQKNKIRQIRKTRFRVRESVTCDRIFDQIYDRFCDRFCDRIYDRFCDRFYDRICEIL